jgi:hypothetical protein
VLVKSTYIESEFLSPFAFLGVMYRYAFNLGGNVQVLYWLEHKISCRL